MKIISFAWTTDVLLAGKKTVTRRDWTMKYGRLFKAGEIVQAYSKSPRAGGRKIGEIRLTKEPYLQWLHEVTDEDEVAEGHLWGSGKSYQEFMGKDRLLWVVEFEKIMPPKNASEFLDRLTDFLTDFPKRTKEEMREDLLAKGINPGQTIQRVQEIVKSKLEEHRLTAKPLDYS